MLGRIFIEPAMFTRYYAFSVLLFDYPSPNFSKKHKNWGRIAQCDILHTAVLKQRFLFAVNAKETDAGWARRKV